MTAFAEPAGYGDPCSALLLDALSAAIRSLRSVFRPVRQICLLFLPAARQKAAGVAGVCVR